MIDRVAFEIFGITVYWYGIILAAGLLAGLLLTMKTAPKAGLNEDIVLDAAIYIVPLAIIGARLYYVAFMWKELYASQPWWEVFAIWHGGLAIYGAVIGGAIGAWLFTKRNKVSLLTLLDVVCISLILGQAIGRWGNFVNQEAYGYQVTNPNWQFFPFAVKITSATQHLGCLGTLPCWHLATFFYESMWNFIVFALLMVYFYRYESRRKPGDVFLGYLVLYGFGRMIIEGLRTDSLYWGPFRISQVLSGIMVIVGIVLLVLDYKGKLPRKQPVIAGTEPTEEPATELTEEEKGITVPESEPTEEPQKDESSDEEQKEAEPEEEPEDEPAGESESQDSEAKQGGTEEPEVEK